MGSGAALPIHWASGCADKLIGRRPAFNWSMSVRSLHTPHDAQHGATCECSPRRPTSLFDTTHDALRCLRVPTTAPHTPLSCEFSPRRPRPSPHRPVWRPLRTGARPDSDELVSRGTPARLRHGAWGSRCRARGVRQPDRCRRLGGDTARAWAWRGHRSDDVTHYGHRRDCGHVADACKWADRARRSESGRSEH